MRDDDILEEAASWHARQDHDDMDWSAFKAWLEADERHREAFDEIALLDADLDRHRLVLAPASSHRFSSQVASRSSRARWLYAGGATALAAAAAAVFINPMTNSSGVREVRETTVAAVSTERQVSLGGTSVVLAPRSTLRVSAADRNALDLVGRAVFNVQHDPSRVLTIHAAGFEVTDVGTRFEIISGGKAVRVVVSQGEVMIRANRGTGSDVRVAAGTAATGMPDGSIIVSASTTATLAGWRGRSLVYDGMPLGLVVADVSRSTGASLSLDAGLAGRPFSGVLSTASTAETIQALAALAGLEARRQGDTVHLGARTRH